MRTAEIVVKILEKEGITDAFGIPGAGINPVYKYLETAAINHYCMRHEEACVHAADGYYRAKHKIALAICTAGPGATNFVTGLYTANIDSIPVLAIVGQANTWQLDKDPFQCVDMPEIARTVTKKVFRPMKAEDVPVMLKEAFTLMKNGKPGPVVIDYPLDVQMAEIEFNIDDYEPASTVPIYPDMKDIDKAIDLLETAASPVIIMGGGVILSECEKDVIALAEKFQIPVITTYMAKGGIPLEHPLNAGHMGIQVGQPIGNRIFLESDLVIGIGCRFSDRHTGDLKTYCEGRKFIHIDIEEKQIGKVFKPDLGIVSDTGFAVKAILKRAEERKLQAFGREDVKKLPELREQLKRKTDYDTIPMMPHRVFHEINKAFPGDTYFTAGCGITQIWGGQLQEIDQPRRYLPSGGAGTLGYEIPAAFGAKVAFPENYSVTVVGDFGFTFMGEEIAVASRFEKPIIVVILNNAFLGLIRQNQKGAYGFEYAVEMECNQNGLIDYIKVAEGFGCSAERVVTPLELASALERAKKSGKTYVIDAICVKEQLCDMGNSIAAIKSWAPQNEK